MHLFSEERLFYREIKHGIFKSVCPDKVVIFHSNAYIILHHTGINLSIRMSGVGVGLKQNRWMCAFTKPITETFVEFNEEI